MKKIKKSDNDFFLEAAKISGGKILKGLNESRSFIDTGNLANNFINSGKFIGGGIPTGITEVFGPPASSKSLLGYTVLGNCQKAGGIAILLDCERAANEHFAVSAGHVDENSLIVLQPFFIEEVERKVTNMTRFIREKKGKDIPILFVWDSIAVTPCEREWNETELPENYSAAQFKKIVGGKTQPGERAKAAGNFLRKINPFLDEHNASLFIINQIRQKIGVMFGSDETTGGGGKALEFYCNCRIRTSAGKQILDDKDTPIGVNLTFRNKKGRSARPFMSTTGVQLYFDKGINPLGGLLSVLDQSRRIEAVKAGVYKVLEPYANGQDITFKSSVTRNDVPADVVIKCPALIDAQDSEQVKDYLGIFQEAIDYTNSGSTKEVDILDDLDFSDEDTEE